MNSFVMKCHEIECSRAWKT